MVPSVRRRINQIHWRGLKNEGKLYTLINPEMSRLEFQGNNSWLICMRKCNWVELKEQIFSQKRTGDERFSDNYLGGVLVIWDFDNLND